jgi:hypothetical protein
MKQVKLIVGCILFAAVLGGTLAFKAKKFTNFHIFQCNGSGNQCSLVNGLFDANPAGAIFTRAFTSFDSNITPICSLSCIHTIHASPE